MIPEKTDKRPWFLRQMDSGQILQIVTFVFGVGFATAMIGNRISQEERDRVAEIARVEAKVDATVKQQASELSSAVSERNLKISAVDQHLGRLDEAVATLPKIEVQQATILLKLENLDSRLREVLVGSPYPASQSSAARPIPAVEP